MSTTNVPARVPRSPRLPMPPRPPAHRHGSPPTAQLRPARTAAYPRPYFSRQFLLLSVIYIILCVLDIVSFTIWPSVKEFLGELDVYLYFAKSWEDIWLSPWGVRTLVALPALAIPEFTPLDVDQAFGLYCGLLLMGTTILINRAAVRAFDTRIHQHEFAVAFVIYTLGYFMNGRLCPAFLGSAILMHSHVNWFRGYASTPRTLFFSFIGLPLMTVSSGTFLVGFITIIAWATFAVLGCRLDNRRFRFHWGVIPGLIPILYVAGVQSSIFLSKISDYYGGDLTQVLNHGYGDFLHAYLPGLSMGEFVAGATALTPFCVLFMMAFLGRLPWAHTYLVVAVVITLSMGACGYSTMFTNTPTIVLCGALFLSTAGKPRHPFPRGLAVKVAAPKIT